MTELAGTPEEGTEILALRQRNAELHKALLDAQEAANSRLIAAELRAEAVRSGMIDLDGLKLLDKPDVLVGDDGTVRGARRAVTQLRQDKPWLFGERSSSSTAPVPATTPPAQKMATEMSLEEWRRARAELIRRK